MKQLAVRRAIVPAVSVAIALVVAACTAPSGHHTPPPPVGPIQRVNVSTAGAQDDGGLLPNGSAFYDVTADGTAVVFSSLGRTLAPGGNNGGEVFRRDLVTGTTTMVGLDYQGHQPAASVTFHGMSSDGRFILLTSVAPLAGEPDDGAVDLYRRDLMTGQVIKVSPNGLGNEGELSSHNAISDDGRFVVYYSPAGIMVRDLQNSTETPIPDPSARTAAISGNGRYLGFFTPASLIPSDTNGDWDFYLEDLQTSTLVRMSAGTPTNNPYITLDGSPGGLSGGIRFTPDGRFAQFAATGIPVMRYDRQTGTLFDLASSTAQSLPWCCGTGETGDLSDDGRYATMNFGGPSAQQTVWLDTANGATLVLSDLTTTGTSDVARASADGLTVVFESNATDLVPNDTNGVTDLFVTHINAPAP
jgi:hypothetical protein